MGGPALLLNGACEECSNARLRIQAKDIRIADEIGISQQLVIYYGREFNNCNEMICVCGERLNSTPPLIANSGRHYFPLAIPTRFMSLDDDAESAETCLTREISEMWRAM
jgi:hypothetical protein